MGAWMGRPRHREESVQEGKDPEGLSGAPSQFLG